MDGRFRGIFPSYFLILKFAGKWDPAILEPRMIGSGAAHSHNPTQYSHIVAGSKAFQLFMSKLMSVKGLGVTLASYI